ncbi:CRISPR-associated endoribonuclease Cas6 [Allocoleopsis franciscana]|uniref:CRISPR-associated protein, Cas6 family n=1 Tax=Allocoleopsis franciscana PCC 7113 TaxID=1173027 RepID=K9WP49_9CYAN|nr:CRISPR-associated endoribonuclease Cas6 [Allocoleopsis franciscana]AFZ22165.1 CRISPR-associated protein, Cas6 family [Allocoleopsis franciscana PCC 7113]
MAQRSLKKDQAGEPNLTWPSSTELVGLVFEVIPQKAATLYPEYTKTLHAWFLDQVRSHDPQLSASLHDDESKKPFTISGLDGKMDTTTGGQLQLLSDQTYYWTVTAFSPTVVQWLGHWLEHLPPAIELRYAPLQIQSVAFALPPTTYAQLYQAEIAKTLTLSFLTPTSFRRKGHHLPLPWPVNVFHSYLRRWNEFSGMPSDDEAFLAWVDESVLISRHQLESVKVAAGKQGKVTGFLGAVEYSLTSEATKQRHFQRLFTALGQLAPYCGTGHKTTFGLGQTRLGWLSKPNSIETLLAQALLAKRVEELTDVLMQGQKRTGGDRAIKVCQTQATILARQEAGESLIAIAQDLDMPYETVKTYVKRARHRLKSEELA